jgi:hypothetical protein
LEVKMATLQDGEERVRRLDADAVLTLQRLCTWAHVCAGPYLALTRNGGGRAAN